MERGLSEELFEIIGPEFEDRERILRPTTSYVADAWRRLKENKIAMLALILLSVIVFMVIFGPAISGYDYQEIDPENRNVGPNAEHWFGTDKLGRDLFARTWQGGRVSMIIGITGAFVSSFVGCIYGGISGYLGGRTDDIMMRIVEILMSVPYLIVVILLSVVLQSQSLFTLILAMTLTGWCNIARIVRGQVLQVKSQEYILAAEALGVRPWGIITKHIIPNVFSVVIVAITFDVPGYIFAEAFLSFIGLGVQPPGTSWGALASSAQGIFLFYPYQLFFPALMIALSMLCFTLLGDGLRDALDPRLRQ
ncbi:MAG TPA: ABC transporter permease [Bacillota bacterium]|nr:ABC transporter permease [Bacillota bacterium]